MGVAYLSAYRSKDPRTNVGACIVNTDKRIIGIGYNGMPSGCWDKSFSWESEGEWLDTKYPYVVHAEANAILNSTTSLKNSVMYVKVFPCNECAKLIIQSGIREIVYVEDYLSKPETNIAAKKMFDSASVTYRKIDFNIAISFEK